MDDTQIKKTGNTTTKYNVMDLNFFKNTILLSLFNQRIVKSSERNADTAIKLKQMR
jgi:hypothetical protein